MSDPEWDEWVRDPFLGEIESVIVGTRHHNARILPGEQVNLEREAEDVHDRRAIRVENGQFEPVGYLPRRAATWLAPLIDQGKIHLDGYMPQECSVVEGKTARFPVVLMVFQREAGRRLLQETEPLNELETLHQTVLQAYKNSQRYCCPELILGLAKALRPLEKLKTILPETRLLLAFLPRMAHELRISIAAVRVEVLRPHFPSRQNAEGGAAESSGRRRPW